MVTGTQGEGIIPSHIDHHSGAQADRVCSESSHLVGVGRSICGGVCFISKFSEEEGTVRVGDLPLVHIDGQGTTGKFQRAYLRAYHPYCAVFPMASISTARFYLALPAIGGDVCIGGAGMVDEGCGAFEVDASTTTSCGAFATPIGGTGISALVNIRCGSSPIGRNGNPGIDHQVGCL